ncbi:GTP cyclohydrolase N terminal-domain-containing protein [Crucibulum laeve]|uniref:GTP cyclohydrolase N terminal-domain-containing protein n=1 Tax=Crucibulum laeve TaxID=68775 RepID=A0A5C3LQX0_9AGAR|nr:GTP cyclohydrolase N terminal-domain-containing protein [Crucibulum laeve]
MPVSDAVLTQILAQLEAMQVSQQTMQAKLDALTTQTGSSPLEPTAPKPFDVAVSPPTSPSKVPTTPPNVPTSTTSAPTISAPTAPATKETAPPSVGGLTSSAPSLSTRPTGVSDKERERLLYPGRVNLTTYPDQHGIKPVPLSWGASDPSVRGPIICSRLPSSIKTRNAIGAHSGSYSIYRALSIAMGALDPTHKPDYSNTEPPVDIPPNPAWFDASKIVSFDPWGHLVPSVFNSLSSPSATYPAGLDIRPSIAVTKAHLKMSELDDAARKGELKVDGSIVLQSRPIRREDGSVDEEAFAGVEVATSKAAVEPVWYLPGVAERFGISESLLRRALFEDTGGMYPELITRPDVKVFLPPIGGLTVYIFSNPACMRDETKELTLRVHDECNGSDVFGSDICTCKPYLTYAIEECIRTAQKGGVGVVVYFRKEGRALGEVTKYLVYNLRKRGGDSADKYFKSTEMIAGVKDMRFQALMPDVLHWMGIKKIDNMVSMSDMKYDAIVKSGIPILKRYDIPDHLIPPDSRVEIDAKIAAGYFSSGKQVTQADLVKTVGRTWEETEH